MTEPQSDDLKLIRRRLCGVASGAALLGSLGVASAARAAAPRRSPAAAGSRPSAAGSRPSPGTGGDTPA